MMTLRRRNGSLIGKGSLQITREIMIHYTDAAECSFYYRFYCYLLINLKNLTMDLQRSRIGNSWRMHLWLVPLSSSYPDNLRDGNTVWCCENKVIERERRHNTILEFLKIYFWNSSSINYDGATKTTWKFNRQRLVISDKKVIHDIAIFNFFFNFHIYHLTNLKNFIIDLQR